MQRTEADILSKAPIKITLGETEYQIKPLALGPARLWRQKVVETMGQALLSFKGSDVSAESMAPSLNAAMIAFPEKLLDIVMAFAPYLPKEEIEESATDEQMAIAYGKVMGLGFPFLAPLMLTRKVLENR